MDGTGNTLRWDEHNLQRCVSLHNVVYYTDDPLPTCIWQPLPPCSPPRRWSFGVALWELVTVGGTPYAEINPEDLYAQLHGGMRMPCPSHCAQEV